MDNLIVILAGVTLLLFILNIFYKGNTVQSCIIFILTLLPLMNLKITSEAWGGFKTFDAICFYCILFLLKDFITVNLYSRNNLYFVLFIFLTLIFLIGGLASEFPDKTIIRLLAYLPIFIFARFFLTECYKDPTFYLKAIKALKVAYIINLAFLLIQVIVGLKFTFYPILGPNTVDPVFHIVRYPGTFYDSQGHGQYLAMGSFLFLFMERSATKKVRILNYLVFVLAIVGINLAGSRAAFGGFVIGGFVAFFIAAQPRFKAYGAIAIVAGYIIFATVSVRSTVFDRAQNLSEDLLFRQSIWKEAFEISKRHPYLGIGSGNYQNYVIRHAQGQYLEIEDGQLTYFDQPENGYLKIMVELGFIGFTIFALLVLIPLIKGLVYYLKNIYDKQVTFFMASLISWLVAFNTVYSIYDYRILIMVACMFVLIISYPHNDSAAHELATEQED